MKPRAEFNPRLRTWKYWVFQSDIARRLVGFGWTLEQAMRNWQEQHDLGRPC